MRDAVNRQTEIRAIDKIPGNSDFGIIVNGVILYAQKDGTIKESWVKFEPRDVKWELYHPMSTNEYEAELDFKLKISSNNGN